MVIVDRECWDSILENAYRVIVKNCKNHEICSQGCYFFRNGGCVFNARDLPYKWETYWIDD